MRAALLVTSCLALACGGKPQPGSPGGPLQSTGECPELGRPVLPRGALLHAPSSSLLPLGIETKRVVELPRRWCPNEPTAVARLTDANGTREVPATPLGLTGGDGLSFLSLVTVVTLTARVEGRQELEVEFGGAGVVRLLFTAVEDRTAAGVRTDALRVDGSGRAWRNERVLATLSGLETFVVGPVVWVRTTTGLESWVVRDDELVLRARVSLPTDATLTSIKEAAVIAIRAGEARELRWTGAALEERPITVPQASQVPVVPLGAAYARYWQASPTGGAFNVGFTGGQLCELDSRACTVGPWFFAEVHARGLVAIPASLDRFVLFESASQPALELPLPGPANVSFTPLSGVEGEGSFLDLGELVLVPEFDPRPRWLAYARFGPQVRVTRDWVFIEQQALAR